MINNTLMGRYPVPNPIPNNRAKIQNEQLTLILAGAGILRRLESFGLTMEDIVDPDKVYEVLTPREFTTFYTMCDFTQPGYSSLLNILATDFFPFNKYSLLSEKKLSPTEISKKYIDELNYATTNIDPITGLSFMLGYSIDKVPEQLTVEFVLLKDNLFLGFIKELDPVSTERYIYNVCDTACNKLYEIYGSRWVASTRVFSELVRLSQLSALNRNS